jgi:23S rRNA pseudouridine2605 synthase
MKKSRSAKTEKTQGVRLQKILAESGLFSRRKAEEAILEGRVQVNGKTVTRLGVKADLSADRITCDGRPVKTPPKVYVLFHKPAGVICTSDDPQGRKTATGMITEIKERLYSVGRLDFNTAGLLLMTNDGDFSQKMMKPSSKIVKKYIARVRGIVKEPTLLKMKQGITVDGVKYRFNDVRVDRKTGKNTILHVSLTEGKKRQIRILCQALGHPVVKLSRVAYGSLKLSGLQPGDYRHLSQKEVKSLLSAVTKPNK